MPKERQKIIIKKIVIFNVQRQLRGQNIIYAIFIPRFSELNG